MTPNLRRRVWSTVVPIAVVLVVMVGVVLISARSELRGELRPAVAAIVIILLAVPPAVTIYWLIRGLRLGIVEQGLRRWHPNHPERIEWAHLRLRKEKPGRMVLVSSGRAFVVVLGLYREPVAVREFVLKQLGLPITPVTPPTTATRRRQLLAIMAMLAVLILNAWMLGRSRRPTATIGGRAPDFTAKDMISNQMVSLGKSGKGRTIVLSFWEQDCTYCTAQLLALDSVRRFTASANVRVVAIHLARGDTKTAASLVTKLKVGIESWHDVNRTAERRFGITGTPATAVIDEVGCIQYFVNGTGGVNVEKLTHAAVRAASRDGPTRKCS